MRSNAALAQRLKEPVPVSHSTERAAPRLAVSNLKITYRKRGSAGVEIAVESADFAVSDHEFVCLVGPSGCGKSSILNAIAGLLRPAGGTIFLDGTPVAGPGRNRSVVFQSPALLPWRTALENARYGLELWGVKRHDADARARAMLELVGLEHRENRYPHELSGGMQQRVNLARALAADPEILLLDEPFAALDAQNRETMQTELLRIWTATRKTSLFVTHQIDEAILLADRVIVLSKGPSRVKEIVTIDLPRPRGEHIRRDPSFVRYEDHIRDLIRLEQVYEDHLGAQIRSEQIQME
nr:ABC transporter ATP-binding protein [Nitrosomonas nitrosa]